MNNEAKNKIGAFSSKGRCAKCGVMYFHGTCNTCPPEKKQEEKKDGFKGAVLEW